MLSLSLFSNSPGRNQGSSVSTDSFAAFVGQRLAIQRAKRSLVHMKDLNVFGGRFFPQFYVDETATKDGTLVISYTPKKGAFLKSGFMSRGAIATIVDEITHSSVHSFSKERISTLSAKC